MELVTQATGGLISKLGKLLEEEYKVQTGVRAQVASLSRELESMQAAIRKVSQVPWDELDELVRLWARDVREASYDMEDILDTFLVHVEVGHEPAKQDSLLKRLLEKMSTLYKKLKTRHKVAGAIKDIKKQLQDLTNLRARYTIDNIVAKLPDATSIHTSSSKKASIDHHLISVFYTNESSLVGIDKPRDALVEMLSLGDGDGDVSNKKMKEVCIFGFGGLGKTTLAKAVHDKFKVKDNSKEKCKFAFVPVGRTPDLKKVFMDILIGLGKEYSLLPILDQMQLINELREFLKDKRYFIIIDDVWDATTWDNIRLALEDNNLGSKIIITTRNLDVAEKVGCSYKMEPLPYECSRILFYGRIFGSEGKCPRQYSEVCENILKKCGGVPLAIQTISSLLVNYKSRNIEDWYSLCHSIGSGLENNNPGLSGMRKILSLGYYDLPSHMKPCLLYLSIFPEDYMIRRTRLIRRWISEDLVQHENKDNLFELGESYFNELVNRSLVQPTQLDEEGTPGACYVHDMVLDFICSMSRQENFVTIPVVVGQGFESSGIKVRRLSLQSTNWPTTSMSQVRSVTLFRPITIDSMPPLSCFNLLRVLDLEGCTLNDSSHLDKLRFVGNLFHLKYLGLRRTEYDGELPKEIGKLQLLRTLDLSHTRIRGLPSSLVGLKQLMCLDLGGVERLPNGVGNLTSLQVLRTVRFDPNHPALGTVKELSKLTQLKVLDVWIGLYGRQSAHFAEKVVEALVESLGKLSRIERLKIDNIRMGANLMREVWVPPPCLRSFVVYSIGELCSDNKSSFSTLPAWINPASLLLLSRLQISVDQVRQEDIQVLGLLPALRFLDLSVPAYPSQVLDRFTVSTDAFPCVRHCRFAGFVTVPSMFPRGAFPMLEHLDFEINLDDFANGALIFDDLAIGHLPSIRFLRIARDRKTAGEEVFMKVKETLRHHATIHPNNITIVL